MTPRKLLSPTCVEAKYVASRLPHFQGNPLIEALPLALEPDEVFTRLSSAPKFDEAQRDWSMSERLQMLKTLSNFMVPLTRHMALATELDSLLRNGYVGRRPDTPEFVQRLQALYESRMGGDALNSLDEEDSGMQQALLLMGLSGMGKTKFVRRWTSSLPQVIYHPALHIYQIPVLHIELPSNGESVAGLCNGIFSAVDKLVPGNNYLEHYALRGRPSVETLIQRAASVLHRHCVGMLIGDEVQNLTNAGKNKQTVMTELVSLSNVLSLPVVFIGTNKAAGLFGLDFRQSRRVSGMGTEHWDRLHQGTHSEDGRFVSEWREFLKVLWQFQWTKQYAPMTEQLADTMYWCCQGVIDTCIKLFAAAQARAMLDGTELLTPELLRDVYHKDFALMHPMLDALRSNDAIALSSYSDIRPIPMTTLLESMQRRAASLTSAAYTVKPSAPDFVSQVAAAVTATGFDAADAIAAADEVSKEGKAKNLLEATEQATGKLKQRRPVSTGKSKSMKEGSPVEPDYSSRPGDLRHAIQLAKQEGTTVLEKLKQLNIVRPLEDVLRIH